MTQVAQTYRHHCGLDMPILWIDGRKYYRVQGGGNRSGDLVAAQFSFEANGSPIMEVSLPMVWLNNPADLRSLKTSGSVFSKLPPEA